MYKITDRNILMFDVESDGLYGTPFSVAAIVINKSGEILDKFTGFVKTTLTDKWAVSTFGKYCENITCFDTFNKYDYIEDLYVAFYDFINKWNDSSIIYGDCIYPVETSFLENMITYLNDNYKFIKSPYPILDVASVLQAYNVDPDTDRIKLSHMVGVEPHNPLHDSLVSSIVLLATYHTMFPIFTNNAVLYVEDENISSWFERVGPNIKYITREEFNDKVNNEPGMKIMELFPEDSIERKDN